METRGRGILSSVEHWGQLYATTDPQVVSWYQAHPVRSLALISRTGLPRDAPILDVGGGASSLVDHLLNRGYTGVGVLDLAQPALEVAKARLGPERAAEVEWYVADVREFTSPHRWELWHDRAVFHFLTAARDRAAYRTSVLRNLSPTGHVVIATFALAGPERCSGLPVARYDAPSLAAELGAGFELLETETEHHRTPGGVVQPFTYCRFRRVPEAA